MIWFGFFWEQLEASTSWLMSEAHWRWPQLLAVEEMSANPRTCAVCAKSGVLAWHPCVVAIWNELCWPLQRAWLNSKSEFDAFKRRLRRSISTFQRCVFKCLQCNAYFEVEFWDWTNRNHSPDFGRGRHWHLVSWCFVSTCVHHFVKTNTHRDKKEQWFCELSVVLFLRCFVYFVWLTAMFNNGRAISKFQPILRRVLRPRWGIGGLLEPDGRKIFHKKLCRGHRFSKWGGGYF